MKDDEKDTQVTEEAPAVEEISEDQVVEKAETAEVAEVPQERPGNGLAEKRSRMIVAGMLVAIIVSVIVVVVAGVFQLTYRGMVICPRELPVNDPAKVLWQEIVAQQDAPKPLGVPETLLSQTQLKGPSLVTKER